MLHRKRGGTRPVAHRVTHPGIAAIDRFFFLIDAWPYPRTAAITSLRRHQPNLPTRSEAIRTPVERGLEAEARGEKKLKG